MTGLPLPNSAVNAVGMSATPFFTVNPAFSATDDCSVVARYLPDQPIAVVEGDERNLKVTTPVDLEIVAALLRDGSR